MEKVTQKEAELLRLLADYRILLSDQIAILTGTGVRSAQKKISKLHHQGMITISARPLIGIQGRPEHLYSIGQKGIAFLKKEGLIGHFHPGKESGQKTTENIEHDILTNWFRIYLAQIDKHFPDLETEFISQNSLLLPIRNSGLPLISETILVKGCEVQFIPDGVFSIISKKQNKRLLFFLETDMSSEAITSTNPQVSTIAQKMINYQTYFLKNGYKRYEKKWNCQLNGFRCLFLTDTSDRAHTISKHILNHKAKDFYWITDRQKLFKLGLSAKIWHRGGNTQLPPESIIGPSLARDLAVL